MKNNRYSQRGVGMIEILVSLVILAVGLLSVATLHVNIVGQSQESKTRSEAIAIAESRLEEIRNFGSAMKDIDDFNAAFPVLIKENSPETKITGTNAEFSRKEVIGDNNNVKTIDVYVQWDDKDGAQEILVNSSIVWAPPRSSGDAADSLGDPLIPSATGRARLGDGIAKQAEYDGATPTGDGMRVFDSQDGDLRLVDKDKTIVLTLVDACDIEGGNCTDFVEISGIVYIESGATIGADDIYVKASDAAYCQLYYMDSDGKAQYVTASNHVETTGSDYDFYRYTCYLGGGWHGNIGIIFGGLKGNGSKTDKICVGDPTSNNLFEQPVEASRRVYRGMLNKNDVNGLLEDGSGNLLYYSIGVSDALKLPHENEASHDFVISTGNDCQTIMTQPDSNNGSLFSGMPNDFYCLNDTPSDIDNFDTVTYSLAAGCPYDPSLGPATRHVITGTVAIISDPIDDAMMDIINATNINTSDSAYNCTTQTPKEESSTEYSIDYTCDVYDWADVDNIYDGWQGYIQVNTDYSVLSCDSYREQYTGVTSDKAAVTNTCISGGKLTVSGSVPASSNKGISEVSTTDNGGHCEVSDDKLSYACYSSILAEDTPWTGTLAFTLENGVKFCIDTTGLVTGQFEYTDPDDINIPAITLKGIDTGVLQLDLVVGSGKGGKCE